ncbi:hypothetical protein CCP2SC5_140008 [Azospirillaceae bacterium]
MAQRPHWKLLKIKKSLGIVFPVSRAKDESPSYSRDDPALRVCPETWIFFPDRLLEQERLSSLARATENTIHPFNSYAKSGDICLIA